jgi:acyl-homoserine lactone acylase PvdQ
LTLAFLAPMDALQIPLKTDKKYPNGFPRHGTNGTPDPGGLSPSLTDYSYSHGPGIRFVCDLDPSGLHARNVLPGGETFDLSSPHYKDMLELWRHNRTFDLAFADAEVVASANKEYQANMSGRVHFTP